MKTLMMGDVEVTDFRPEPSHILVSDFPLCGDVQQDYGIPAADVLRAVKAGTSFCYACVSIWDEIVTGASKGVRKRVKRSRRKA